MKPILFAPETWNLSETLRMLAIAEACCQSFNPVFLSYGGRFNNMVRESGFPFHELEPRLTDEKAEHLVQVDRMEKRGDFFEVDELTQRVENETELLRKLRPVAVVTGFCLSTVISCRAVGTPLVWVIAAPGVKPYFHAGLGTWPDAFDSPFLRWVPEGILNWITNKLIIKSKMLTGSINQVARAFEVPEFSSFLDIFEGDCTLLSDVPEMTGIKELPPTYYYIGPILSETGGEMPVEIISIPKDKPIVYFAMGSSGNPQIIREILEGFSGKPYRVIAPVLAQIQGLAVNVPENVLVTGWIPALKVNPMADISVIHGGQGTVYTACTSGTPVVGVGMQPEQEANLECLVRKGIAIRIRKRRLTSRAIIDAIDKLLQDTEARTKAQVFSEIVKSWNGAENAAKILAKRFGR
jgi:UDP:flavonoid glycosyltransferase YjiC (YdhE family)